MAPRCESRWVLRTVEIHDTVLRLLDEHDRLIKVVPRPSQRQEPGYSPVYRLRRLATGRMRNGPLGFITSRHETHSHPRACPYGFRRTHR
jgi:hypothetical protein